MKFPATFRSFHVDIFDIVGTKMFVVTILIVKRTSGSVGIQINSVLSSSALNCLIVSSSHTFALSHC